jgi:hypothetical protein
MQPPLYKRYTQTLILKTNHASCCFQTNLKDFLCAHPTPIPLLSLSLSPYDLSIGDNASALLESFGVLDLSFDPPPPPLQPGLQLNPQLQTAYS